VLCSPLNIGVGLLSFLWLLLCATLVTCVASQHLSPVYVNLLLSSEDLPEDVNVFPKRVVAQINFIFAVAVVKALCYKSEGREFETR
jgi:hypothetical protein